MARIGIDLLRYAVKLFSDCNETFNQKYSASELLQIADTCQKIQWDIYPDEWHEHQIAECLQLEAIPDWKEDNNGKLIPIFKDQNFLIRRSIEAFFYSLFSKDDWFPLLGDKAHEIENIDELERDGKVCITFQNDKLNKTLSVCTDGNGGFIIEGQG